MIIYRFQAWKISRNRVWEIHRTYRKTGAQPMLLYRRWGGDATSWPGPTMRLQRPDWPPRRDINKRRVDARPSSRLCADARTGPMQSVNRARWERASGEEAYRAGHRHHRRSFGLAPASCSHHALVRLGLDFLPF